MGLSGSAAGGAWEIPTAGVWQLHAGETVLPPAAAEGFNMAEGGGPFGAAGGETHIHIHTIDVAGVQQFVKRYAGQLASEVQVHMANNPSFAR